MHAWISSMEDVLRVKQRIRDMLESGDSCVEDAVDAAAELDASSVSAVPDLLEAPAPVRENGDAMGMIYESVGSLPAFSLQSPCFFFV